jgi:hypothetical protein
MTDDLAGCGSSPDRIVLVSNDYRQENNRKMDDLSLSLAGRYKVVSNSAVFPAQITVYERTDAPGPQAVYPARLALPEQDVKLPLIVVPENWSLDGFVRLDHSKAEVSLPVSLPGGPTWVASC